MDETNQNDENPNFPGRFSEERLEWYDETLKQIVGRKKEPVTGGSETWFLVKEVRPAFVNGLFISTIFLCAAAIEQMLFSELNARGIHPQDKQMTFAEIIQDGEEHDLLTAVEVDQAHDIRSKRIGFFHYRDFSHPDAPMREAIEEIGHNEFNPWDFHEPETKKAIRLLFKIGIKPWTNWRGRKVGGYIQPDDKDSNR